MRASVGCARSQGKAHERGKNKILFFAIWRALQAIACGKGLYHMKVFVIIESDGEWFEVKRVVDTREKADVYVQTSLKANALNGVEYFYPIFERTVE